MILSTGLSRRAQNAVRQPPSLSKRSRSIIDYALD